MLEETCISCFATTHEFTVLSIQTIHSRNGTGTVKPLACLNRHETHTPCRSTVPKARRSKDPSGGRSEVGGKFSFLSRGGAGRKRVFPTTPKWDVLGVCGRCQT